MADNGQESGSELATNEQKSSEVTEKAKQATNTAKNVGKEMLKGKGSMLAPLVHILVPCAGVLVFIIIIIGIIMFFLTVPGMMMDKLNELFSALGDYIAAFYGADTTKQIDEADVYDTMDYLEQMGIDLKADGFLTDYMTENDIENPDDEYLDEDVGVIRSNDDDTIVKASSDFIYIYMFSDNYVYTLKNDNIVSQSDANGWFGNFAAAIVTSWYKIENFFFGPVFDFLGITNAVGETFGKGLIAIYYEDGDQIGVKGTLVNDDSFWNWDGIEINTDNKTLSITRNEFLNLNNAIEYDLDGWTGRYGMPIEFLISVHKATNKPDLAYDMATSFNTNVNIYLHDISGTAVAAYKTESGEYISYETLNTNLTRICRKKFIFINYFMV